MQFAAAYPQQQPGQPGQQGQSGASYMQQGQSGASYMPPKSADPFTHALNYLLKRLG